MNHKDHNFIADNFLVSNCIGGVAAFDQKEGVISPGGVGFDINCLTPDTKILTEDGYFIKLEKLKEKLDLYVKIYNTEEGKEKSSNILFVSERVAEEKIIRIKTESGRILEGSKDHPVLTLNGYVPVGMLKEGDDIVVYPFEGVEYEELSDEVILDEEDFADCDKQIIKYLKDRDLLPFKMNNKNIGIIARLLGFAYGDGSIVKENGGKLYLAFYGKKETLIKIKEDLEKLKVKSSKIYSRKREVEIKNAYGDEYTSLCKNNYIKITSKAFALFMHKLGMPIGKKTEQKYNIPEWIKKAPKWVKRNFLAGLFGADGSRVVFKNYTPLPINLTMSKSEELNDNILEFLNEIKHLLKEFEIESVIYEIKSLDGRVSYRLAIVEEESIRNFLGKINYEYAEEKKVIGLLSYEYLKRKDAIKEIRRKCIEKAKDLYEEGLSISEILKMDEFRNEYINRRLIERAIYGMLDGEDVRVSTKFPKFEEFIKKYGVGGGFVIDKIKKIEEIPYDSKLYDVGIVSKEHNFIANNIVVHNCGVRLIRTNLTKDEVEPKIKELIKTLFKNVPSGLGSKGIVRFSKSIMDDVLEEGVRWAVREGYGWKEDLEFIEEHGCLKDADASYVSDKAKERGRVQLGSLGSGNHFLEVQYVERVFDEEAAEIYGIEENQVVVMVHTGSRGLGHQICTDYLRILEKAAKNYGIKLPDRQLACAPFESEEGQSYFKAMCCGANYAWANRQMITHWVRESFEEVFKIHAEDLEMSIVYDVAHNIAKKEEHIIDGRKVKVVVHRKGATRAFPPGHEAIPKEYREVGQPVIIPGDMGTASYLMRGTEIAMKETFGSTAHGAGRKLSRAKALKLWKGKEIQRKLAEMGIIAMSDSKAVMAEEAPEAYKNIDLVADTCHRAGISLKVARMRPLGVIKG
ncbi:intein-containing RctB family protein [Methanocaldococcus sp. 28A]